MISNDYIEKYLKILSIRLADGCNLESERGIKVMAPFFFFKFTIDE